MFDGVDMYVIEVIVEIFLITDQMLPEVIVEIFLITDQMLPIATLPNTPLTTTPTRF